MRYVIDIDGVLCTEDTDLDKRQPYVERIAYINELYDAGHEITIFTARGMRSTNGDQVSGQVTHLVQQSS